MCPNEGVTTMGLMTQATIAAWQEKAGITPGEDAGLLTEISDMAFELIKIVELEKSGIRDGDGYWHGSDPVGGTISHMRELFDRLYPPPREVTCAADSAFACKGDSLPF
jgi:hypothetical protein